MIATAVNAVLILLGSLLGLLFKNRISARMADAVTKGLALCVAFIGVSAAIGGSDTLCMIVSMVVGILIGEAVDIERRLDDLGESLRRRLKQEGEGSRFTEGFVTASLVFCIGSMAVMGALQAGVYQDYSTLISKGVLDGIAAITFSAAMGAGVAFSALPVFLYQGALTLVFAAAGPVLGDAVVAEMSAVGGAVIFAISLNMMGVGTSKLRVGNMLPAIFLPIVYLPIRDFLTALGG